MSHQNFQEAIEQLSTNEDFRGTLLSNPAQIKNKFDLSEEDMKAMKSYNPLIQAKTPVYSGSCIACCSCC